MTDPARFDSAEIQAFVGSIRAFPRAYDSSVARLAECAEYEHALRLAAEKALDEEADKFLACAEKLEAAEARAEAAEKDKLRLDFLESYLLNIGRLTAPDMGGLKFTGQIDHRILRGDQGGSSFKSIQGATIRTAIDAAMAKPESHERKL